MTYPSNLIGLAILEVSLNWGLDVLNVQPPFISAKNDKREFIFKFLVTEYYEDDGDYYVDINEEGQSDYTIVFFINKKNDNVALLDSSKLTGGKTKLKEIAECIKQKWEWEVEKSIT